jgi:5-methylcytosine-specific restriction endonuclease McrA
MAIAWKDVFDTYGIKKVSKTDKKKGAYVPNKQQKSAVVAAGKKPMQDLEFDVTVLHDPQVTSVKASYYLSLRSTAKKKRAPEPRMGHALITAWLDQGDQVLIGNIGPQLFAVKLKYAPATEEDVVTEVAKKSDKKTILDRAKKAKGKPAKKVSQREEFVRNPWVVAGARKRSDGKCEVPGCACGLFLRDDDSPYLEVHHIIPLAEGGDDTLLNAAAICPHCHRVLHHGKERMALRAKLAAHVAALP